MNVKFITNGIVTKSIDAELIDEKEEELLQRDFGQKNIKRLEVVFKENVFVKETTNIAEISPKWVESLIIDYV